MKIDINLSWQYHVNDLSIKLNINYETITMKPQVRVSHSGWSMGGVSPICSPILLILPPCTAPPPNCTPLLYIKVCSQLHLSETPHHWVVPLCTIVCRGVSTSSSQKINHSNRANPPWKWKFSNHSPIVQTSPLKMNIFWPLPNFHRFPDFGLHTRFCLLSNSDNIKKPTILQGIKIIQAKIVIN